MTQMKKLTWMMLMALTLGACSSKDEPLQPQPDPQKNKIETPQTPQTTPSKPGDNATPGAGENGSGNTPTPESPKEVPSESVKALRAVASWRAGEQGIYGDQVLEDVLLGTKSVSDLADVLGAYLTITSSTHSGVPYSFSAQELTEIKIVDLALSGSSGSSRTLSFRLSYKGVKSTEPTRLSLNLINYYDSKVAIPSGVASKYYLGGVFEHLPVLYNRFINYDQERYAVILQETTRQASHTEHSLQFSAEVRRRDNEELLAVITKTVAGFRPLSDLDGDLMMTPTHELVSHLKQRATLYKEKLEVALKASVNSWVTKASFALASNGGEIVWSEGNLVGEPGNDEVRDIYLRSPKFELVSAQQEGGKLHLTLRLVHTMDAEVGATCRVSISL